MRGPGLDLWSRVEDGQFLPENACNPHVPLPGGSPAPLVEQGFWRIYGTLQLADPAGALLGSLAPRCRRC